MILVALAFVGLAAFIGLAVDAGILFTDVGHLRRAVDAGALAAANQYRRNVPASQLAEAAQELLQLNNLSAATAVVHVCDVTNPTSIYMDTSLCPPGYPSAPTGRYHKYVSVRGSMPVNFAFLPIIGLDSVDISASAQAEAASLDLVLVIDESNSMAFDGADTNPDTCNPGNTCYPFHDVKAAATSFVNQMYFPFDHVAVVSFADHATTVTGLTGDQTTVLNAVSSLQVQNLPSCPHYPPDPSGCLGTDIADGLLEAGQALTAASDKEAVWVTVLLTDGAANQAYDTSTSSWICPGTSGNHDWIQPFCRDGDPSQDNPGVYGYDAEDAARDAGYLLGCYANGDPDQSTWCQSHGVNGVGSLIFTIGLGDKVINDPNAPLDPNAGERLLREVANIGDDGDLQSGSGNPCSSAAIGTSCGNYYYSPTGGGLSGAFDAIAKKIFTRLTK